MLTNPPFIKNPLFLICVFIIGSAFTLAPEKKKEDSMLALAIQAKSIADEYPDSAKVIAQFIIENSKSDTSLAFAYAQYALAEAYFSANVFDSSKVAYKNAMVGFVNRQDSVILGKIYNNIGLLNYFLAELDSSLYFFDKALHIETQRGDLVEIAELYQNIAFVYDGWERYDLFFEHCQLALDVYNTLDMPEAIAGIANNMGLVYCDLKRYEEAYDKFNQALEIYCDTDDALARATVLANLGRLYSLQADYENAINQFNEAIPVLLKLENKKKIIDAYSDLANVYKLKGDQAQAIEYFVLAQLINESVGEVNVYSDNLYDMYESYKAIGDYKNALLMLEGSNQIRDSLFTAEKYRIVIDSEKKYYSEKREKELLNLRIEEQRKGKYIAYLMILVVVMITILIVSTYVLKMKEKEKRNVLVQKILRTQMNPHFIFNVLSGLQCLILEERSIEAFDYVGHFSKLMRLILQHGKYDMISLSLEKDILESYIFIQNMRFKNGVNCKILIDEGLVLEKVLVPPLMAQPFIENAIEHGELTNMDDNLIIVSFSKRNESLVVIVEDNGVGINKTKGQAKKKGHKSMALDITRERIKYLQGKNNQVDLKIEDLSIYGKSGTRVEYHLPYVEK